MEIKNGIIIDGVLHELKEAKHDYCLNVRYGINAIIAIILFVICLARVMMIILSIVAK
jgi:hypothetical protein